MIQNLSIKNFFFYPDMKALEFKPNSLEHAYLCILNDNLKEAKTIFKNLDSPRAKWGVALVSILEGYLEDYPTYFQIRNFLEIDLDFLIKNEKIDYVEQFLGSIDFLTTINQEAYKFTARVMFENKLYSAAINYMNKSKIIYYNDPELHFMLSKYYEKVHDEENALFYINECCRILPNYYPAQILKQKIEEKLF